MSTNVNDWKVTYDNVVIGQVLSFVDKLEQSKIVSKALDGTVYIQTIGSPVKKAEVSVFCSREEKSLMDEAEASAALIRVVYRDEIYLGHIEAAPQWQTSYPGKWYSATITLLIEEV